jgi:hypothetical protein
VNTNTERRLAVAIMQLVLRAREDSPFLAARAKLGNRFIDVAFASIREHATLLPATITDERSNAILASVLGRVVLDVIHAADARAA